MISGDADFERIAGLNLRLIRCQLGRGARCAASHDHLQLGPSLPDHLARSMAMPVWTLQDAKNRFSAVVDAAARGEPQKVTRRGKWVSVVL